MGRHIKMPIRIQSAGNKPKIIDEYIGLVNSGSKEVSMARMQSPPGWTEPAQIPEFNEYTLVIKGAVHVKTTSGTYIINAGEAYIAEKGEKVQYSTPGPDGAEYVAVCVPAFSPETVHRKQE